MELNVGTTIHGFSVRKVEDIPEVGGTAFEMLHEASGAKLLYVANDDANKAFSIAFKTPPANDTGVFHILEHSVLCGSKKYPVKEPFVNLLKSSMKTFLNAMTFPDKTMYPVASINEKDLMNLMDVYMDAVLNPNIYAKETIFQQEGWHLETAEGEDGSKKLQFNGVVFNEMKGSLSNPDNVLFHALMKELFPDTAYSFESGGDPEYIPNLTYEEFLDNHRRHYSLSNSYIFLYGDMDVERFLQRLDSEHLAPALKESRSAGMPNPLPMQAPVISLGGKREMVTSPESSCSGIGFVIGSAGDHTRELAIEILLDALAGTNEAPLKKAVLEAELADTFIAENLDSVQQPFVLLELRNLKQENSAGKLMEIIRNTTEAILAGGIDKERIAASLARLEFKMRENANGLTPDGVDYAIKSMQGWLYDDECATTYLKFSDSFEFLKGALNEGYFEELLKSLFLDNNHYADIEIVPAQHEGASKEAEKLEQLAESFSDEDFDRIARDVQALRATQERADTPEEIATLPHLGIDDIGEAPGMPQYYALPGDKTTYLHRDIQTNGITYVNRCYDASCVTMDEISYLTLFSNVLGQVDTKNHSAAELEVLTKANLGSLNFAGNIFPVYLSDEIALRFVISGSALEDKTEKIADLTREIIFETDFSPETEEKLAELKAKVKFLVFQQKNLFKRLLTSMGHTFAMQRLSSYYTREYLVRDHCAGIEYYRFLCELSDGLDSKIDDLLKKFADLANRLFKYSECTVSFAGSDEAFESYRKAASELDAPIIDPETQAIVLAEPQLVIPKPVPKNEAFVIPADICYAAYGCDSRIAGVDDHGKWLVIADALSYNYLWDEVRVKGGAYGVFFHARWKNTEFASYRDPNLDSTIEKYKHAGEWLAQAQITQEELEGYIISNVSSLDVPTKPGVQMINMDIWYFAGYDRHYHYMKRKQVIETTLQDLREAADFFPSVNAYSHRCVFGSKDIISKSNLEWQVDELLNK